MKARIGIAAAVLATAGFVWAAQAGPVNKMCPVKTGSAAQANLTATYKGKTIGFCCGGCKTKFTNDPEAFIANIPELAGPAAPAGLASASEALEAGKTGSKPTVLLFVDAGPKTEFWYKALADASVAPELEKCAFAKIDFKKDDPDAKKLKVSSAGVLVIVDSSKEEPKVIKSLTAPNPKNIAKELAAAAKKLADGK